MALFVGRKSINFTCSHDEVRPEHEIKFYSGRYIELPEGMTLQQAALQQGAAWVGASLHGAGCAHDLRRAGIW